MIDLESRRQLLQKNLDLSKSQDMRNQLGQFSTPYPLAHDILSYLKTLFHDEADISFLEPAIGTGVFYSAFLSVWGRAPQRALGFEIDPHYSKPARALWSGTNLQIVEDDFFNHAPPAEKFSFLISNPPYSRHHHIAPQQKQRLQRMVYESTGIKISGLAGLYCYFMILSTRWLKPGAISCWLIPGEFMDVNFGKAVKQFLLENVNLLRIHRFLPEDLQFSDALVTSSVVIFQNEPPGRNQVTFSEGGRITAPTTMRSVSCHSLISCEKWTHIDSGDAAASAKLGDYFEVKRGVVTGRNDFFILSPEMVDQYEIPATFLIPVLPSPKAIKTDVIEPDSSGDPLLEEKRYLFSCNASEDDIMTHYPKLWNYLQEGVRQGIPQGYLCSRRTPWYSCEKRLPAPFLVNYMGRNNPGKKAFRFFLNNSRALATNVFLLLYPKPFIRETLSDHAILRKTLHALNEIPPETIMRCGRVYGGGLCKLEPQELLNTPVYSISNLFGQCPRHTEQGMLF